MIIDADPLPALSFVDRPLPALEYIWLLGSADGSGIDHDVASLPAWGMLAPVIRASRAISR